MNLLLDTHVLIWALENNPMLAPDARGAIIDGENMVFVSSASAWEISIEKVLELQLLLIEGRESLGGVIVNRIRCKRAMRILHGRS